MPGSVDTRWTSFRSNWSDDLRGVSSESDLGLSGELGAEAMTEELMRSGEDTRGSTGLRLPRLRGFLAPRRPVPALLADCGVLKRVCTARLRLEGFWPLADELDGRCVLSSAGSECLGEMRPVWYDIACGSASGLTCCGELSRSANEVIPTRMWSRSPTL